MCDEVEVQASRVCGHLHRLCWRIEIEGTSWKTECEQAPYTYCVKKYRCEERTRTTTVCVKVRKCVEEEVPADACGNGYSNGGRSHRKGGLLHCRKSC